MRTLLIVLVAACQAHSSSVSANRCKKTFSAGSSSQFVGRATWQDEPQQTIVATTEDRTVGRSILTCTIKLPSPSTAAVLEFGGARIAFGASASASGAQSRPSGSRLAGLEIEAVAGKANICTISGLQVHRENWMELGPARYALRFAAPVDRVTVIFILHDPSPDAALRADINPVIVRAGRAEEAVLPCPPAVR